MADMKVNSTADLDFVWLITASGLLAVDVVKSSRFLEPIGTFEFDTETLVTGLQDDVEGGLDLTDWYMLVGNLEDLTKKLKETLGEQAQ